MCAVHTVHTLKACRVRKRNQNGDDELGHDSWCHTKETIAHSQENSMKIHPHWNLSKIKLVKQTQGFIWMMQK